MGKAPCDAELYFHALDREISAMLQRLLRRSTDEAEGKKRTSELTAALIRRSRLADNIVLPNLRDAGVPAVLIDPAEQDCQAIWLMAEDLADISMEGAALTEKLKQLFARHQDRVQADEFLLWPTARIAGADLVSIANRLIAASYEEVGTLAQPRAVRNKPADPALGLFSAVRGESHGQGRAGRDSTSKSRSPRGRRTIRQGGKRNSR